MSANFDWQTEDDDRRANSGWDELPTNSEPASPRRRPPWRLIAVVALLAVITGGIIWWRVDQRINATMQAMRVDVVASHNLAQRAAAEGDEEIFRSVLSGREPAWTAGELELFNKQLFVDRSPLGLVAAAGSLPVILPEPNEETSVGENIATIELSPDLNEAIVTVNQPYQVAGTSETVVLQQTTVYRRGDLRWLLAPPLDEFWGDWVTLEGDYLSLIFPARDEAVAARLAGDLDAEIGRMCATLADINCSPDLHLTVRLDTDPATLASLTTPLGALRRAREREDILELPAPTLAGLPLEDSEAQAEAGYQALRDGYARHLLSAVIAQAVGWRCCNEGVLFNLLLEYQLGELGLVQWPIGDADYQRVLDERVRLSALGSFLRGRFPTRVPEDRMWEFRAAIDFLANAIPGASAAEMQRIEQRTRNFEQFLNTVRAAGNAVPGTPTMPTNIDLAWWLYAFAGPADASASPDLPTHEELYLTCTAVDGNQSSDVSKLFRYLPEQERWSEVYNLQGFIWMSPLPDPTTLLMQEFALEFESWRTNIWRNGEAVTAFSSPDGVYSISLGETDATGRQMVAYTIDPESEAIRSFTLDLSDCEEGCATRDLPGRPSWSPNGEWAVYVGDSSTFPEASIVNSYSRYVFFQATEEFHDYPLTLGPGDAAAGDPDLIAVDPGRMPFWLDNETYGYIHNLESGQPSLFNEEVVVTATINDPTPRRVISAADLFQFLPGRASLRNLHIAYVATHPNQPGRLFIAVFDDSERRAYILLYELGTGLAEVRLEASYNLNHSLSFSPDGRFLVMTGDDRTATLPESNHGLLLLHDLAANRTIPLMTRLPFFLPSVGYDWTEDNRWLALALEDNLIALIRPDDEYVKLIPHGYGACTSVAWLQP